MGGGHGHLHTTTAGLRIGSRARVVVLALIVLVGVLAVLGVLRWWPDAARVHHLQGSVPVVAAGVTTVRATLGEVRTACADGGTGVRCGNTAAHLLGGDRAGTTVPVALPPDVVRTGLRAGDHVLLLDLSKSRGAAESSFEFYRADRAPSMLWLAILFVVAVLLVARWRGLMALIGLAFAGAVVLGFLVPALLSGGPPVPVMLAASVLILIVLLYATHGISMRTSVALLGALAGLGLSAAFAWYGVIGARLAGLGDDSAELLLSTAPTIDVQQLVVASVIVAGLGTLNDITVTQASALWELREAAPAMHRRELFTRAMRIGRDHVASSVYTLVFAYLGTALVLLVAVQLYRGAPLDFVTAEDVAEEIVRTLVGGIALVLAMPLTTAIGTLVVAGARNVETGPHRRSTAHGPVPADSFAAPARRRTASIDPYRSLPPNPWEHD